jgi:hypothetical protein
VEVRSAGKASVVAQMLSRGCRVSAGRCSICRLRGASASTVARHLRAVAAVIAVGPDLKHARQGLAAAAAAAW